MLSAHEPCFSRKQVFLKDSALEWRFYGWFQKSYGKVRCFLRFFMFLSLWNGSKFWKNNFKCSPLMSYDFPEKVWFEIFCPRMTILCSNNSKIKNFQKNFNSFDLRFSRKKVCLKSSDIKNTPITLQFRIYFLYISKQGKAQNSF